MKWPQQNLFGFPRLEDLEPGCILANRLVPGSVILLYWEHNSEPYSRAILVVKSRPMILLISAVVMRSSLSQEHNTMSAARAGTWTGRSGEERTNYEVTAPHAIRPS